jgi:hypothetical protein
MVSCSVSAEGSNGQQKSLERFGLLRLPGIGGWRHFKQATLTGRGQAVFVAVFVFRWRQFEPKRLLPGRGWLVCRNGSLRQK